MSEASDYIDAQIADNPAPVSASDYLDSQLGTTTKPSGTEKLLTAANAPFSGLLNAGVDTALGASQALGSLLPENLSIGGFDVGSKAGSEGIKDLKSIKDQMIGESMQDNPAAKVGYTAGDVAGNVGMFSALAGSNPGYLASAGAGALTSGIQPVQNDSTDMFGVTLPSRLANAAKGGLLAGVGKSIGDIFSPQVTDSTKQAALQTAEDFGIPVFRTQVSGSPLAKAVASMSKEIPGSGAGAAIDSQVAAFNRAVLGTIGQTGDAVTPEALANADQQIGNVYDTMTAKYNLPVNKGFVSSLDQIEQDGKSNLVGDKLAAFTQQLDNVRQKVTNAASGALSNSGQGVISGDAYQNLRSNIGRVMRGANGSPEMGQVQNLLDQQFQGSMNPFDAQTFQTARSQYRNMLALEKVVANSPNEPISPAKLQGAVKNVFGNYAYGGGSPLERLSRLGNLLKDTDPNSGTATRNQLWDATKHVLGPTLALGAGGELGREESGGSPVGMLAGAGSALALSRFGITPYLYSKMSSNPAMMQSLLPALGPAALNQFGSLAPPAKGP